MNNGNEPLTRAEAYALCLAVIRTITGTQYSETQLKTEVGKVLAAFKNQLPNG